MKNYADLNEKITTTNPTIVRSDKHMHTKLKEIKI